MVVLILGYALTFIALQMKSFGQKNFIYHPGLDHFGNFSEWAGMAVPC